MAETIAELAQRDAPFLLLDASVEGIVTCANSLAALAQREH